MGEASRKAIERFHATIKVSFFVFKMLSKVIVTTEVLYSKCSIFAITKARQQPKRNFNCFDDINFRHSFAPYNMLIVCVV